MKLDDTLMILRPAVEVELQRVLAELLPTRQPELRSMLAYAMGWEGEGAGAEAQGKRIRPVLLLLSASAAGGDWRKALPAAAAVEYVHNFSLIHDDIQDGSRLRRGRPTVWVKWGTAQAINTGDVMFTLAHLAIYDLCRVLPAPLALDAASVLDATCMALTEGQYLDLSYEQRSDLTQADYWPMIAGKTAALLGCCAELGALSAGAAPDKRAAFRRFAESLGLAFQVQDDWLGIWGDAARTGKSTQSDLVSGKKTLPVLYALERGGAFAARWRRGPVQPEEVSELAQMLVDEGAQSYTAQTADRLTAEALQALDEAAGSSAEAEALRSLAETLLNRSN
ncbi:MAG TPA: polyprenyl synthetase family protein [Anaerolineaceae bacterium]